jgi:hypothetical protein
MVAGMALAQRRHRLSRRATADMLRLGDGLLFNAPGEAPTGELAQIDPLSLPDLAQEHSRAVVRGMLRRLRSTGIPTWRGLEGRVRQGRSAGGLSYACRIVRTIGPGGAPRTGEREVDPKEAEVVRSIFADFAAGRSPGAIAKDLNLASSLVFALRMQGRKVAELCPDAPRRRNL